MRRRLAAFRVAARIARRNARRSKGRTALIAVMVGLPVAAAVVLDVLVRSSIPTDATRLAMELGEDGQAIVRVACPGGTVFQDLRGDATACPTDAGTMQGAGPGSLLPSLTVTPVRSVVVPLGTDARAVGSVHLHETDLTVADLGESYRLEVGTLPGVGEVALARWVAERLDVAPGDTVVLGKDRATTVVVSGVLDRWEQASALALPGTVPEGQGAPGGEHWFVTGAPVDWPTVLELNDEGFVVMSRAVIENPPPRSAMPFYTSGFGGGAVLVDGRGFAIGAAVIGIGVLEAVLLIGPAFAVGARRATRDLALLAANGAERRDLRGVMLANGVVIGGGAAVAAGLLGLGLGAALVAVLAATVGGVPNLVLPWGDAAAFMVTGALIAIAAAWLPARSAARVDVVAALSGRRAEARPRRRVPVVGAALLAVGIAVALAGAARSAATTVVVGVVLLMVGMVAASGAVVTALGRLARWAPLALRLAMRDAARQRGRTAPAVAAVIAAVAGAVAGAIYISASEQRNEALWVPSAAVGTVQIAVDAGGMTPAEQDGLYADVVAAVDADAPLERVAPVRMLVPADERVDDFQTSVYALRPPENECPLWALPRAATSEERAQYADDPRCRQGGEAHWSSPWWLVNGPLAPIVDDGGAIGILGLPGADAAARALARGEALVGDPLLLWPDGTVHLVVEREVDGEYVGDELVLPGWATGWRNETYQPVLPSTALPELEQLGLTSRLVGAVAQSVEPLTAAQVDTARQGLGFVHLDGHLQVEEARADRVDRSTIGVVGTAALVALAATWIAVGLAAAESRADMATLAAVGAAPRTRRRIAGAQAAVLTVTGSLLGTGAGVLLGVVFVRVRAAPGTDLADPSWQVVMPWPALAAVVVGLPLVGVLAAAGLTRSRLPTVRRLAS